MNAFISYSHNDSGIVDVLHKHLAQLKRDGLINIWTDNEILAGSKWDDRISAELKNSNLFIAVLSPDFIASNYCYENEFKTALTMQEQGEIIIIPIIAEPCDWLNTPFKEFNGKSGDTDHPYPVQIDHPKLTSLSCIKKVVFGC